MVGAPPNQTFWHPLRPPLPKKLEDRKADVGYSRPADERLALSDSIGKLDLLV